MVDTMTPLQRSQNMARIRGKDTLPELLVRRLIHRMGFRFRLHRRDLPGRPDIVFPGRCKVIFIHGCFWHHHQSPDCRNAVMPKTRTDWWAAKFTANAARDMRNETKLAEAGWDVLVLWECELSNPDLSDRIRSFLKCPNHTASGEQRKGVTPLVCEIVAAP
jgi:DNA mismatch endonuclease (patch repair protein)